jgi:hypothetical protein
MLLARGAFDALNTVASEICPTTKALMKPHNVHPLSEDLCKCRLHIWNAFCTCDVSTSGWRGVYR